MNKQIPFFESLASNILLLAGLMLVVMIISFLLAKKLGGESKAKKKIIFTLTSGFGLLLVALYITNKISGV